MYGLKKEEPNVSFVPVEERDTQLEKHQGVGRVLKEEAKVQHQSSMNDLACQTILRKTRL